MTEVLISDLAQMKGWRVISRTSTEAYRAPARRAGPPTASLNSFVPMEATFQQALGLVHYYGRRFGEAAAAARRALELRRQPPFARVMPIKLLIMNGDHRDAVRVCDDAESATAAGVDLLVNCAFALAAALRSQDNLPPNLQFDPLFDALRADERYAKLIR